MTAQDLAAKITANFGELISAPVEFRGEVTFQVLDAEKISDVCAGAKRDLGFDYLVDISSVDNYGEDPRFTIVYELYGYPSLPSPPQDRVSEEIGNCHGHIGLKAADWHEQKSRHW
jgi:NADH-quinone oxidoreductase subunit C